MSEEAEAIWPPKRFFYEAISGIAIFSTIAGAAVLLSVAINFLKQNEVDIIIVNGLKIAEYAIFFVDLILFFRFLYTTTLKTWREL